MRVIVRGRRPRGALARMETRAACRLARALLPIGPLCAATATGALLPRAAFQGWPPRVRGSGGGMRTVAPAISAFGPSTAIRRRHLVVSGSLGVRVGLSALLRRPSKPAGVLQGVPRNPKRCPNAPILSVADPRNSPRLHPYLDHNSSPPLVGVAAPSSVSRPLLTQTPTTTAIQVPQPAPENRPPGRSRPARRYRFALPSSGSSRPSDRFKKSHPAILAVTGSDHSAVALYFRNWWAFSTGIRSLRKSSVSSRTIWMCYATRGSLSSTWRCSAVTLVGWFWAGMAPRRGRCPGRFGPVSQEAVKPYRCPIRALLSTMRRLDTHDFLANLPRHPSTYDSAWYVGTPLLRHPYPLVENLSIMYPIDHDR